MVKREKVVGAGSCANVVDAAWREGERDAMIDMVSIQGTYGRVDKIGHRDTHLTVHRSTYPWTHGEILIKPGDIELCNNPALASSSSLAEAHAKVEWGGRVFRVEECRGFSDHDVRMILRIPYSSSEFPHRAKL